MFLSCLLSNTEVEKKSISLNRLDCFGLGLHLIPGLIDNALPQQFESEVGFVGFVADVCTNIVSLLNKYRSNWFHLLITMLRRVS